LCLKEGKERNLFIRFIFPHLQMTIGKNERAGKKKGSKRRLVDPFSKKEWYELRIPDAFFGKREEPLHKHLKLMPVTKSAGTRNAADSLRGRIVELSLGDLKDKAEEDSFRKFRLRVEEVQGKFCLTNFWGMDITRDKLASVIRKWQSLIEAHCDIKTSDGYTLRFFVIGFTKRRPNQTSKFTYAQHAQIKNIRKKMIEVVQRETAGFELKDIVTKLTAEIIGKEIEKLTQGIFPLWNVLVRKVKVLHAPKVDVTKLLELHGGAAAVAELGQKVERVEETPAAVKESPKPAAAAAAAPSDAPAVAV